MAREHDQRDLFPTARTDEQAVVVNDRCLIRTQDGHRVIVVSGIVLAQYALGERLAFDRRSVWNPPPSAALFSVPLLESATIRHYFIVRQRQAAVDGRIATASCEG
jgi:hypothetical protein